MHLGRFLHFSQKVVGVTLIRSTRQFILCVVILFCMSIKFGLPFSLLNFTISSLIKMPACVISSLSFGMFWNSVRYERLDKILRYLKI